MQYPLLNEFLVQKTIRSSTQIKANMYVRPYISNASDWQKVIKTFLFPWVSKLFRLSMRIIAFGRVRKERLRIHFATKMKALVKYTLFHYS